MTSENRLKMKSKKKLTQRELEELRDDVIRKQQELIKLQEKRIALLQAELTQMQYDAEFEQTQQRQQQQLRMILGNNYPDPIWWLPKIY